MIISKQAILITILWIINLTVFSLYLWPEYPKLQELYITSQQTSEKLNKEKDFLSRLDTILTDVGDVKDKIKIANAAIPVGKNIPELITQITALISSHSLTLANISIASDSNIIKQSYKTLNVAITVSSDYESFKTFIKSLENNLTIMDVNSFSFKSPEKLEDPTEFKLSFQTYYQ